MDGLSLRRHTRAAAPRLASALLVAAVLVAAILAAAAPAAAHTALEGTDPAPGAGVSPGVGKIRLRFTGPIDRNRVGVRLRGPDGVVIDIPAPRVGTSQVVVELPRLTANGRHVLDYRVRAADGHPLDGRLRFAVRTAARPGGGDQDPSEPAGEEPSEAPTSEAGNAASQRSPPSEPAAQAGGVSQAQPPGGPSRWLLSLAAVVALAGGLAVAGIHFERRREPVTSQPEASA